MVKLPSQMATWLSPKGRVKKHNLYSKQPSAWRGQPHAHPEEKRRRLRVTGNTFPHVKLKYDYNTAH